MCNEDDDEEDISNDGGQESNVDMGEENIQDSEDATTLDTGKSKETNKGKIVVAPHKKLALSEVANILKVMAETSLKRFKMMVEEDKGKEEK